MTTGSEPFDLPPIPGLVLHTNPSSRTAFQIDGSIRWEAIEKVLASNHRHSRLRQGCPTCEMFGQIFGEDEPLP